MAATDTASAVAAAAAAASGGAYTERGGGVLVSANRRRAVDLDGGPYVVTCTAEVRSVLDGVVRGAPGAARGLFLRWSPRWAAGGNAAADVSGCEPAPGEPAFLNRYEIQVMAGPAACGPIDDDGDGGDGGDGGGDSSVPVDDKAVWEALRQRGIGRGGDVLLLMRCCRGGGGATVACLGPTPESLTEDSDFDDPEVHADRMADCVGALLADESTLEGRPYLWLGVRDPVPTWGELKEEHDVLATETGRNTKRAA